MNNDVAMAIIEALGESILVRNRNLENCKEHIDFLAKMNEDLRKKNGELIGRNDEKIKAECEAIENGTPIGHGEQNPDALASELKDVPCTPYGEERCGMPEEDCGDTCEACTCDG